MARYYVIKNNTVSTIGVFNSAPTNTSELTYISCDSINLKIGSKYNTETDTIIETLDDPIFTFSSLEHLNEESKSLHFSFGKDIYGLYTTSSEGVIDDATTCSVDITFNKNIQPLSQNDWQVLDAEVVEYTSKDDGSTFKLKVTEDNTEKINISIPKFKIISLDGEYLREPVITSYSILYEGILSGSVDIEA